ncbi:MAG TPA: tetratricopeptide repeat protein [Opitutaceae bacterium]|nr:tetratricopeptide repeat protein [Opitutaceae bacterium]
MMSGSGSTKTPRTQPRAVLFAAGVVALGAVLVYLPVLSAPFVFDDLPGIVQNPTIRKLSSLGDVLWPAQATGTSVVARPLVNLSLALNYAVGGLDPRGYRAFNLFIHVAASLALFGVIRRTLLLPGLNAPLTRDALPVAFGVALLWTLHPLQTESVTCVIQRTELLAGLFLLLTFYGFVRSVTASHPGRWRVFTIAMCFAGMLAKEVMVAAPLLLLLYDRTFVGGSFREAWRQRKGFLLGLAASWVPLGFVVLHGGGRGGTVGFSFGVSPWEYLLTQCHAIALYLKLSVWPQPLVLDYGMQLARGVAEVWPQALLLLALAFGTLFALWRGRTAGFLGAWFFAILAPSSSFVPLATQTIAEHRMYLPLAAVVVAIVAGVHALGGRRGLIGLLVPAFLFAGLTLKRNADYRSPLAIWSDTVTKAPGNPRAHYNLANALSAAGRAAEAGEHYETALRLQPGYSAAHYNLAGALLQLGREAEAIVHYRETLRLDPHASDAHANLASLLLKLGQTREAITHYESARQTGALTADEQVRFGRALADANRPAEAQAVLQEALRLEPLHAGAHLTLGVLLMTNNRSQEALPHLFEVVRQRPSDPGALIALADALVESGRARDAIPHYETVLKLHPNDTEVRSALEQARRRGGVR